MKDLVLWLYGIIAAPLVFEALRYAEDHAKDPAFAGAGIGAFFVFIFYAINAVME